MAGGDEVQRLADIEAIKQLRARYTRAIDTKDWRLFADSLAEDARLSTDRGIDEGREHIVAVISDALAEATTVHHVHQPEIELTGPDAATGMWAMQDLVEFEAFSLRGFGHYTEEYVRTTDGWKIESSTLTRLRVDTEGEVPRSMSSELNGRVAIVTGGTGGIGFGTAQRMVDDGARVVIADLDEERGQDAARRLGGDAAFRLTDVAQPDQVQALVDFTTERHGRLDVVFNNAGISGARKALLEEDFADFHAVLGVNLLGVFAGTAYAARQMAKGGGGSVINNASIGGVQPTPGQWAYNSSKAAVIHFTRSAAIQLGGVGVRVNAIAPGNIETEILGNTVAAGLSEDEKTEMMAKVRAYLLSRQPIQLQGQPADIAETVLFLATERSRYITGTVIPVDGGQLAGNPAASAAFTALRPPSS